MPSLARSERSALCDLFDEVGPDAPTLCEGWATRDLAAHLRVRETSPLAAGIAVSALQPLLQRQQDRVAAGDFTRLVDQVRHPPRWSPAGWSEIDKRMNFVEFFVHNEDVRRAQPGWEPRTLAPSYDRALWAVLGSQAKLLYRKATVGVRLRTPDGRELLARSGDPEVTIVGPPSELVMHAFGRTDHARVAVEGSPQAVAAFGTTSLGI
jgi:uncharacterized protein (TIGR03085 family)